MRRLVSVPGSICAGLVVLAGCRMGVPIHVWQPPQVASTVGKRVVVSTISGPEEIAGDVKQKLLAMAPRDTGRITTLVDADGLQGKTQIRLLGATDQPNDLALASVSRREGADFLLRGEVIEDRYAPEKQDKQDSDQKLKLSWRLTSLDGQTTDGGRPVVVDLQSAVDRYPDLGLVGDPYQTLITAAVRDTYRLITPSVDRQRVQLAIPYLMPGSAEVRRGNVAALRGQWGQAEAIWNKVIQTHPAQIAAVHNLALAAAAGQDFSRAKQLARKAVRLQPVSLHKQTLVWIELRQREYHRAFALGDPPEGWFVTTETPE